MGVNLFKTSHIIFFAAILPLGSFLLSWLLYQIFPNPPFWMETITPLYAYIILYGLFDRYAWSWWIFKATGISYFPDVRGRWKGEQSSTFEENGNKVKVQAVIEVEQTFSKVSVRAYYEKSKSESTVANFSEFNGKNYLFYTYDNDPSSLERGTMQIHRGSTKLEYLSKEKRLMGSYFNGLGNKGDMDFQFEQKELIGRF